MVFFAHLTLSNKAKTLNFYLLRLELFPDPQNCELARKTVHS